MRAWVGAAAGIILKEDPCVNSAFTGGVGRAPSFASKVLAVALFHEGRWVQSFPAFGVERRGAPVTAFLRLADAPIRLRCEVARRTT
jgi:hypothetical protein